MSRRLIVLIPLLAAGAVVLVLAEAGGLSFARLLGGADGGPGAWDEAEGVGGPGDEGEDGSRRLVGAPRAPLAAREGGGDAGAGGDRAGAGAPGHAPPGTVRFGGIVTAQDGAAAAGTRVVVSGAGATFEAETDAAGRFRLDLPPGRYRLLFHAPGLGALALRDHLIDGAAGLDGAFVLEGTVRLDVRVVREAIGVVDADVSVEPVLGLGGLAARTDVDGAALFEEVPKGTVLLVVTLPTGEDVRRRLSLARDQRIEIDVPAGVRVHGRVADATTEAVLPGARIEIAVPLSGGPWATVEATADEHGLYEAAVPQGTVRSVTVVADGYAPWPDRRERRNALRLLGPVQQGREVEMDVALEAGLRVAGAVKDAEGRPVAGLALRFLRQRAAHDAVTDETGAYAVAGLEPGRHDVVVVGPGWFPEEELRVEVPALEPGETHPFDFVVHPTRAAWGTVVHADENPAAGARVWVTGGGRLLGAAARAGRTPETFSDAKGAWRLDDLPADQVLKVRAALGTLEATPLTLRTDDVVRKPLQLELGATVSIEGTVFDVVTRAPVGTATVRIRPVGAPSGRTARTVRTDAEGRFEAYELIPGGWSLLPSHPAYLAGQEIEEDLHAEGGVARLDLPLDPGLVVGGRVRTPEGAPLAGVSVRVWGQSADGKGISRNGATASDGSFRLTGLETGLYSVRAWRKGYRTVRLNDLRGGEEALDLRLRPSN